MGWVTDLFHKRTQSADRVAREKQTGADSPESLAHQKWTELVRGVERDAQEFGHLTGKSEFKQVSEFQYRISNSEVGVALVVTADMAGRSIQYEYEAEAKNVAVPEGGFLSLRSVDSGVALYPADQQLTIEQERRLILEPL